MRFMYISYYFQMFMKKMESAQYIMFCLEYCIAIESVVYYTILGTMNNHFLNIEVHHACH